MDEYDMIIALAKMLQALYEDLGRVRKERDEAEKKLIKAESRREIAGKGLF